MVSLLYGVFKKVLGFSEPPEPDLADLIQQLEGEQNVKLNNCDNGEITEKEIEGCFHKTGIVTEIRSEYFIIDGKFECQNVNASIGEIRVGAKVYYLAFQRTKDEELKIKKILSIIDDEWENEVATCTEDAVKSQMLNRVIVGKVMRREQRMVFIEPGQISFSLDEITSEFLPIVGDWVKLQTIVAVDDNVVDFSGEVLQVDKIFPLRSKLATGVVSAYDVKSGSGTIQHNIVFNKANCEPGYIPCVGDKVVADSIESDQGMQTWRSLSVVPLMHQASQRQLFNNQAQTETVNEKQETFGEEKYGIVVTNNLMFDLQLLEKRDISIEIKNNGLHPQTLLKGCFLSKKSMSQLTLLRPKIDTASVLQPSESITYVFRCHAKFVGYSEEMFLFIFKHLKVRRMFRFNVSLKNSVNHNVQSGQNPRANKIYKQNEFDQSTCVRGVRTCQAPKFITVKPGIFKIPQHLWDVVLRLENDKIPFRSGIVAIEETVPCLFEELTFQNYRDRFHALLYLESIADSISLQRYDISSTVMRFCGEFLALEVPGLAEKRPSLLVGDKAIVSFNWDSSKGEIKYEGCIHEVKNLEILLKFNPAFHEKYNGERCEVTFKCSQTPSSRCHTAVNLAINHLGKEFLFPTKIVPKPPQLELLEMSDDGESRNSTFARQNDVTPGLQPNAQACSKTGDTDSCVLQIKKRKLVWFNRALNYYQKEAVRNVLQSPAHPLPYVIFGPPGTGKTITLCETILQIFRTIPESRLLVATPSNSSANLISERLLDSGVLKPGDLVRLIGFHCTTDGSIPQKLIPYCAVGDLAREGTRNTPDHNANGIRPSCSASVLGRHRITVGTCISLGILHNMGFPRGHFTHVFVDEAGQATEPEILVPLNFIHADTGHVILAGDPMQLGPVVQSKYASHFGLGLSFLSRLLQRFPYQRDLEGFERGYDPRLVTKLIMNYRSLPEILELPNSLFYDSELEAQITRQGKEGDLLTSVANDLPERDDFPPAIVFHGVLGENYQDQDSPSWYNPEEAAQAYFYILKLYSHGLGPDDIGIIAPYTKQARHIRDLLAEMNTTLPKVGSVEEFQGQERNVIILSAVRSVSDLVQEDVKRCLGFIASPHRLNVAITRARALLIILGNPHLLSQDPYWRTVITYCIDKNSYTGCDFFSSAIINE
ncbi:probable RNA helicase armi [Neodiprion fabricii]|uniref:probable RNA helicase armi n=1 Tax=Neodiprion fabricii TaxID=2872261 RepID=UPI001ED9247C|nr:probable RNA helicase armi [Neodiprion fabricii]